MPTVPVYGGRRVSANPLPSQQRNPNAPAAAFGVATPNPIAGALDIAKDIVAEETARMDKLAVTEADNERVLIENELTLEAGQKFRGKDAVLATAWVESERRKRLTPIEQRLNGRQREFFTAKADADWVRMSGELESYAAKEIDRFEMQEYDKGVQNRINAAIAAPTQAPALLREARAMVASVARTRGLGPEQVAAMQGEVGSKLHAGVIGRLLSEGKDQAAQSYMTAHREELVGEDRVRVEKELEQVTSDMTAQRAVNEVWTTQGPKSLTDPVKLADMEAAIREKYGDQPNVLKAARQELRSRVQAHEDQEREVTASNKNAVLAAYAAGASLATIKRMPEYRGMDGADQSQVSAYIVDRSYSLSERARAQRERRQNEVLWSLANDPKVFTQLSDNQIRALEPQVGSRGVAALLKERAAIAGDPSKVYAANLDNTTFKHLLREAEITDEGDQGALWLAMHRAVEERQQDAKRFLTHSERQEVMRSVIDDRVMVDRFGPGTGSTERIASLVDEDDRGDAFVPIERIPPTVVTEGLNYLRSLGVIPPNLSDAQARERYKARLQKAYGRRVTGGSATEIEAALRGQ